MVKQGDAFRLAASDDPSVKHIYIVVSEPAKDPDKVVMVLLTTFESWKDESCTIDAGEHPRVTRLTCVDYWAAKTVSVWQIENWIADKRATPCEPVGPELLARILRGAQETRQLSDACHRILHEQHLLR